jgi:hypothetical protein
MRQIYTSPRHENVDRVIALLNEHGIATSLTNRKPYSGSNWKRFSYRESSDTESWPKVWVVDPNDQVRAREVMREAGLDPGSRRADDFASAMPLEREKSGETKQMSVANRVRLVALGLVGLGALLMTLRGCGKI